jgi:hypothetical protein
MQHILVMYRGCASFMRAWRRIEAARPGGGWRRRERKTGGRWRKRKTGGRRLRAFLLLLGRRGERVGRGRMGEEVGGKMRERKTWGCGCGATRHAWTPDRRAAAAMRVHLFREHQFGMDQTSLAAALVMAEGYEGIK